jgi:hypothetical protein
MLSNTSPAAVLHDAAIGQRHRRRARFFEGQKADVVLADKACDSGTLREQIKVLEAEAVIPEPQGVHPA